jgi:monofunctional biosynthetic peptidoglycan transglycosylase
MRQMRGRLKSASAKRLASKGFSGESPRLLRHKTRALRQRARRLRSAEKGIAAASPEIFPAAAPEASAMTAAVNSAIAADAPGQSPGADAEASAALPEDAACPDNVILPGTMQPSPEAAPENIATVATAGDGISLAWEQPSPEAAPEIIAATADEAVSLSAPDAASPAGTGDPMRQEIAEPPYAAEPEAIDAEAPPSATTSEHFGAPEVAILPEPPRPWQSTEGQNRAARSGEAASPTAADAIAASDGMIPTALAQPWQDTKNGGVTTVYGEVSLPSANESAPPADATAAISGATHGETASPRNVEIDDTAANPGEAAPLPTDNAVPVTVERAGLGDMILGPMQPSHETVGESIAAIFGETASPAASDPSPAAWGVGATPDVPRLETQQPSHAEESESTAASSETAPLSAADPTPEAAAANGDAIPQETAQPPHDEAFESVAAASSEAASLPATQFEDAASPADAIPPEPSVPSAAESTAVVTEPAISPPELQPEGIAPGNAIPPETPPPSYETDAESIAAAPGETAEHLASQPTTEPEDIAAPSNAILPETSPPSYEADAESIAADAGEMAPDPSQRAAGPEDIAGPGGVVIPEAAPPSYGSYTESIAANAGLCGKAPSPGRLWRPPSPGREPLQRTTSVHLWEEGKKSPLGSDVLPPQDVQPSPLAGESLPPARTGGGEAQAEPGEGAVTEVSDGGETALHAVFEPTEVPEDTGPGPEPMLPWHGADNDGTERESAAAPYETAALSPAWTSVPPASLAAAPMAAPADAIPVPLANHGPSGMADAWRMAGIVLLIFLALPYFLIPFYRVIDPPVSAVMAWQFLGGTTPHRRWVDLEDISPALPRAVVIAEDGTFCRHWGVDWRAVGDVLDSVENGDGPHRGASTITMQTAKNLFLWNGFGFVRKILEVPLAYYMSVMWPKRRVLEVYLNIAEWGPGIFGAEAAARHHFGKSAAQLTSREAALLAAALPNPILRKAGRPSAKTARIAAHIQARVGREGQDAACVLSR